MEKEKKDLGNPGDYLANERTFLAWMRTSIGIMAFGFVVVKFSLFVKQISLLLGKDHSLLIHPTGESEILGIALVILGAFTILFSYIRYRYTDKQLSGGNYKHSSFFITLLASLIFLVSVLLIVYLIKVA
ncbi:MAG TPA: DUF202 domain-containing protein [Cytophagaceae bacterium]|jgi:putative membrane protein|nr:DUF202 domain-containing protein [Cytophagaceae bacterium]